MDFQRSDKSGISRRAHAFWAGIGLGVLYWVFDSVVDAFASGEGEVH